MGPLWWPIVLGACLLPLICAAPQRLFYVASHGCKNGIDTRLYMKEGEDKSFGTRELTYNMKAGLINGWNSTSVADIRAVAAATDPTGKWDFLHIIGPVADQRRGWVYFITPSCVTTAQSRRLTSKPAPGRWKPRYLPKNQIIPGGGGAPERCASGKFEFSLQRYHPDTDAYATIYSALPDQFPAPNKFELKTWKLAIDEGRQRLYWWYCAADSDTVKKLSAPLYYIELESENAPTPVLAGTVTDFYGHWYNDLTVDAHGNVFMVDWYHIIKFDPIMKAMTTLYTEDYLRTSWHFKGFCTWTDSKLLVSRTDARGESQIRVMEYEVVGAEHVVSWSTMYKQVLYEFEQLGETIYNLAVDTSHDVLYATVAAQNTGARAIVELPLSTTQTNLVGCLGPFFGLSCKLYGQGERLVVGHMESTFASSKRGGGKASNFAPGNANRCPADGFSQLAVLPTTTTYPKMNPCGDRSRKTGTLERLSAILKATSRASCRKATTSGYESRHILFTTDEGPKTPVYLLRDYIAMDGMRTSGFAGFGYDDTSGQKAFARFQEVSEGGGNLGGFPGLKASGGYGKNVVGPAVDHKRGFVYFMKCTRGDLLPEVCGEWSLRRVTIQSLEEAAKVGVDLKKGDASVLTQRHAIIAKSEEVLYTQQTQLFPGPDDTRPETAKLALDVEAQIIYWTAPTIGPFVSQLFYLDISGWKAGSPPFEPCDIGTLARWFGGSGWTSLIVACDGSLWSHEVDVVKKLDFTDKATVQRCQESGAEWDKLVNEEREGFKGCWERVMDNRGCKPSGFGTCIFKSLTYNPRSDELYYSFRLDDRREAIYSFQRSAPPNAPWDNTVLYSGIFYEFPPRNDKGAAYVAGLAVDDVNDFLYAAIYYGSSAGQTVVMLPLPSNADYPKANKEVHKNYWPMDLVSEDDAPIACLYGHESIPHSSFESNRHCEYQGQRERDASAWTGMQVVLPGGIHRHKVSSTSGSLFILPPKPGLLQAAGAGELDWSEFFTMVPHVAATPSMLNGWTTLRIPVTHNNFGKQPSYTFCAELCAVFWRQGKQRCIGFDWDMSNVDCEKLRKAGRLHPSMERCAYSNSGLACNMILVPLDDPSKDDFTAWPNSCFTKPESDRNGNPWLVGSPKHAPVGGWPSNIRSTSYPPTSRSLHFELDVSLFTQDLAGQKIRDRWRAATPSSAFFGVSDPSWPSWGGAIRQLSSQKHTNPKAMASVAASCSPADTVSLQVLDPLSISRGSGDSFSTGLEKRTGLFLVSMCVLAVAGAILHMAFARSHDPARHVGSDCAGLECVDSVELHLRS